MQWTLQAPSAATAAALSKQQLQQQVRHGAAHQQAGGTNSLQLAAYNERLAEFVAVAAMHTCLRQRQPGPLSWALQLLLVLFA